MLKKKENIVGYVSLVEVSTLQASYEKGCKVAVSASFLGKREREREREKKKLYITLNAILPDIFHQHFCKTQHPLHVRLIFQFRCNSGRVEHK